MRRNRNFFWGLLGIFVILIFGFAAIGVAEESLTDHADAAARIKSLKSKRGQLIKSGADPGDIDAVNGEITALRASVEEAKQSAAGSVSKSVPDSSYSTKHTN